MLTHLFAGLTKWAQTENGELEIEPDLATEIPEPVTNEDGTVTYTYVLRDGLKWSDGKDLTANDFVFSWKRAGNAGTGNDYYYLFQNVKGFSMDEPDAPLAIEAVDDKTFKVTLSNYIAYWNQLVAFPVFFPVREDVVANEAWATDPSTYVSNGPYTMTDWKHNSAVTVQKNAAYHDAAKVTMDSIVFCLSDDANNMVSNFENGSWQFIEEIPTNEMTSLSEKYPDEFKVSPQLSVMFNCWTVGTKLLPEDSKLTGDEAELAQADIRKAFMLLFDREHIVTDITQAGETAAATFVPVGMKEPSGAEFCAGSGRGAGKGYYDIAPESMQDNYAKAVETLKKYYKFDEGTQTFTNVPSFTFLYTKNETYKAIGEYMQGVYSQLGITMELENQERNDYLVTYSAGAYQTAFGRWIADYADPVTFLDMWITTSGNNSACFGRDEHAKAKIYDLDLTDLGYELKVQKGTWAETYDALIALIGTEADENKRVALMHKAEDLLMSTGAICPLYFGSDAYMLSKNVQGFYSSPLGYRFFSQTVFV